MISVLRFGDSKIYSTVYKSVLKIFSSIKSDDSRQLNEWNS